MSLPIIWTQHQVRLKSELLAIDKAQWRESPSQVRSDQAFFKLRHLYITALDYSLGHCAICLYS